MSAERFNTTVYGAIGTCLNKPIVFRLEKATTNSADYIKFLREDLLPAIDNRSRFKPILVFDQLRAHKTEPVMERLEPYVIPLPQVTYSSNFNSIETIWSIAKRSYFKHRLLDKYKLTEEQFKARVRASITSIKPSVIKRVMSANRAYLRTYL